jgi:hypothetical protein
MTKAKKTKPTAPPLGPCPPEFLLYQNPAYSAWIQEHAQRTCFADLEAEGKSGVPFEEGPHKTRPLQTMPVTDPDSGELTGYAQVPTGPCQACMLEAIAAAKESKRSARAAEVAA